MVKRKNEKCITGKEPTVASEPSTTNEIWWGDLIIMRAHVRCTLVW